MKRGISPLSPAEIEAVNTYREKRLLLNPHRPAGWRACAEACGIGELRVINHFAPNDVEHYRAARRGGVTSLCPPLLTPEQMVVLKQHYLEGRGYHWVCKNVPELSGVSEWSARTAFKALHGKYGAQRKKKLKHVYDKTRGGVRPTSYYKPEKTAERPPAYLIADRDRRAQLRAECTNLTALLQGDPIR